MDIAGAGAAEDPTVISITQVQQNRLHLETHQKRTKNIQEALIRNKRLRAT